jgi:hypothetical protein
MGCVRSLNGVNRVNPWSLETVADTLYLSLGYSLEERRGTRVHDSTPCSSWQLSSMILTAAEY